MCAVEYIQKSIGGEWDWLDILTGVLLPVIAVLIIFMYGVFK
nr:MAG TPA: periplasmic nitrate reductase [Caudoviricetes sp.]